MPAEAHLDQLRSIILDVFPELARARFHLLTAGWDSLAVDVDDEWIFKFPRDEGAEQALVVEAALLEVVRPAVTLPVPELTLYPGPPLFSRHRKIKGEHLVTEQYQLLPLQARDQLAAEMAQFYAELHRLEIEQMQSAGAHEIGSWLPPERILQGTWPVLSPELRRHAESTLNSWQALPPDPLGTVYGFFDGHGWNMAFDHTSNRLNGIYDFADSGFGPLHQEFIYTNFIARDLTERIVSRYEDLTGLTLDRERIELMSGVLRLSELAEEIENGSKVDEMLKLVVEWFKAA